MCCMQILIILPTNDFDGHIIQKICLSTQSFNTMPPFFFYPTLFFPFSFSCVTSLSSLFQVGTLYFCSLHINNIHAVIRVERDEKNHDIWSTLINCFISFWNVCYFSRERHAQHKSIIAMMLEWVFDILTLIRVFLLKICSHIDFILHASNAKPLLIEVTTTTFSSICYMIINFILYASND